MANNKYSERLKMIFTPSGSPHFMNWLKGKGYLSELFKTEDGFDLPEWVKREYEEEFLDDGEPDDTWVTGSQLCRELGVGSNAFTVWINRNPHKKKRLHYVNVRRRLIPPAIQREYAELMGVPRVKKVPKDHVAFKNLIADYGEGFIRSRKKLLSSLVCYKGRFYVSKADEQYIKQLHNDLTKPLSGYVTINQLASEEGVSPNTVFSWAERHGEQFKKISQPSGGLMNYLSPKQQRLFKARRKCLRRKRKDDEKTVNNIVVNPI